MRRLTTNKTVNDMSMIERAHNACYVKDCNARYRDCDMDIDARELVRKLLVNLAEGDDAFTCDEDFDDWMCDYMSEGIDSMEGLIAVFYTNIWAMADLEEQGKLLKEWIPSEEPPESGKYVLLSFENFSIPLVGQYKEDEEGAGAFYIGDDEESCISQDIIVNAWMALPELYKN